MTGQAGVRQFVSPSGRTWTARLYVPKEGAAAVLRFVCEQVTLDLETWALDWSARSDDELAVLARAAQPPVYR